jgi:hypothetical protein
MSNAFYYVAGAFAATNIALGPNVFGRMVDGSKNVVITDTGVQPIIKYSAPLGFTAPPVTESLVGYGFEGLTNTGFYAHGTTIGLRMDGIPHYAWRTDGFGLKRSQYLGWLDTETGAILDPYFYVDGTAVGLISSGVSKHAWLTTGYAGHYQNFIGVRDAANLNVDTRFLRASEGIMQLSGSASTNALRMQVSDTIPAVAGARDLWVDSEYNLRFSNPSGTFNLLSGASAGDTNAWLADIRARTADLDFGGFDLLDVGGAAFSNLYVSTLTVTNPISGVSLNDAPQVDTDMLVLGGVARTTWPESGGEGESTTNAAWDIDVTGTTTSNETITLWTNTPPANTMWDAEVNVIGLGETNHGAWKLMRTILNNDELSHMGGIDYLRTNYSVAALSASPAFAITGDPDYWALRVTGRENEPMSWSARGMLHSVPFVDLTLPTDRTSVV